jgi:hypothetical protein
MEVFRALAVTDGRCGARRHSGRLDHIHRAMKRRTLTAESNLGGYPIAERVGRPRWAIMLPFDPAGKRLTLFSTQADPSSAVAFGLSFLGPDEQVAADFSSLSWI